MSPSLYESGLPAPELTRSALLRVAITLAAALLGAALLPVFASPASNAARLTGMTLLQPGGQAAA